VLGRPLEIVVFAGPLSGECCFDCRVAMQNCQGSRRRVGRLAKLVGDQAQLGTVCSAVGCRASGATGYVVMDVNLSVFPLGGQTVPVVTGAVVRCPILLKR
jgi:hypothetical protein